MLGREAGRKSHGAAGPLPNWQKSVDHKGYGLSPIQSHTAILVIAESSLCPAVRISEMCYGLCSTVPFSEKMRLTFLYEDSKVKTLGLSDSYGQGLSRLLRLILDWLKKSSGSWAMPPTAHCWWVLNLCLDLWAFFSLTLHYCTGLISRFLYTGQAKLPTGSRMCSSLFHLQVVIGVCGAFCICLFSGP